MTLIQDLRYGVRIIAKAPGFTALAVLALALGVCANTTIFSLINGVIFRPLTGVAEPERLVGVYTSDFSSGSYGGSSFPDYVDYRDQSNVFESLAASDQVVMTATGEHPEQLNGVSVTGNYFELLGVRAQFGRTLQPIDETESYAHAVVISDRYWRRRYNANTAVFGNTLSLNNVPYTIIGVIEPSFHGLRMGQETDFWLATPENNRGGRGSRSIQITGRLKTGATVAEAQTQLSTIATRLAQAYPETNLGTLASPKEPRPVFVVPESRMSPEGQAALWRVSILLFGMVGMVLLIACANVANLLLARASTRRREIAVRLALGASRARLVRQLLTESVLLALIGGASGLLLTQWTARMLPRFFGTEGLGNVDFSVDWRVLVFTLAVTLLTGLLFGLVPSLQATRLNLVPSLKEESASYGQRLRRWSLRNALVVSQLALSLVLLISAGLFVRSLQNASRSDPGFAAQELLLASIETQGTGLTRQQGELFYQQTLEQIGSLPGVKSATLSAFVPISGGGYRRNITFEGYQPQPNEDNELNTNVVGPNFFPTMGIPIVAGREFSAQDRLGGPLVVIVNEELARRYFGGNAIGKRLKFGSDSPYAEIIGVARNAKYRQLREDPMPFIYVPLAQEYNSGMTLLVRAGEDPGALVGAVRNQMRVLNKDVPLFSVKTMVDQIGGQLAADRMIAVLLSIFGGGALLLAAIGIYGVMAFVVSQRTHEIGIRIALGADPRDILKLILGQGLVLIAIGAGVGLLLALGASQLMKSLLFGISATDPFTFVSVVLVLVGVALLACYLPARRAMKVDPLVALRYE